MKIVHQAFYRRAFIALVILVAFSYAIISAQMPQSFLVQDMEIDEASGLAASRKNAGALYTHNDSGGLNAVFVINKMGETMGKILLDGIKNRDWEDIAVGPGPDRNSSYLYVGEIGDNRAVHSSVFVYRFKEPILPADSNYILNISDLDRLEIVYEDGARDAEALLVDPSTADIYLISKREEQVGLYLIEYPQSVATVNIAKKVATLPLSMVTAADISPDGKKILVKTYTGIWQYKVRRKQTIAQAVQGKAKAMKYKIEPQGEAVAWDSSGKGYYTLSERNRELPLFLYYYR